MLQIDNEMDFKKMKNLGLVLLLLIILSSCRMENEFLYELVDIRNPSPENNQPEPRFELGDTQFRNTDGMTMVYVPAGQFKMGSDDLDECLYSNPAHDVSIDAFWIDQTEVTNSMFAKFLNDQGNQLNDGIAWLEPGSGHRGIKYGYIEEHNDSFSTLDGYDDYPVIEVSWYGAAAYCAWIGGRLPTEAEWEYAARGPDGNQYPWGNTFDGERVNYCDKYCPESWKDKTFIDGAIRWTDVGSYPEGVSWCGALDMAGNVWEWVNDWWSENYYTNSPTDNPDGPESGDFRIGRGGSWYDEGWRMNSICRKGLQSSSARMHWVGFRCVSPVQ
jgi:serine/threonine-protein kinase